MAEPRFPFPPVLVLAAFTRITANGRQAMVSFLYRCPVIGLNVQGWVADDPTEHGEDHFEAVTCTACTRIHLVNPTTGRVLGADDD